MGDHRFDVHPLDPADEPRLRRWWEIGHAASLERPVDLGPTWPEARRVLTLGSTEREVRLFGAYDDSAEDPAGDASAMLGAGRLDVWRADNTHLAQAEVCVDPAARRRGVGTGLLHHLEALAAELGRDTVLADVHAPFEGHSPGRDFLTAHGYSQAGIEIAKVVDLPATQDRWPALAEQAAERLGDYRLVWFRDETPEEYVADVCAMFSRFLGEIPLGEIDLRPQAWDAARLRRVEQRRREQGGEYVMVAARSPAGELVGYSDASRRTTHPDLASIHSTLVLPGHRGHRLGLALKVRLHQLVREQLPDVRLLATGNADVNTYMNAVNEQLGYRPVDQLLEMQKRLAPEPAPDPR